MYMQPQVQAAINFGLKMWHGVAAYSLGSQMVAGTITKQNPTGQPAPVVGAIIHPQPVPPVAAVVAIAVAETVPVQAAAVPVKVATVPTQP